VTVFDENEEIDIVIWLQDTILLGEAKCNVYPANPIEIHNYFEDLRQASFQIGRKTSLVASRINEFVKEIGLIDKIDPTKVTLVVCQASFLWCR
jgi:hypothetical protein